MRKSILKGLLTIFGIAFTSLALSSIATAQSSGIGSAEISQKMTRAHSCDTVEHCQEVIDLLNQRLDKALDAFEKATSLNEALTMENTARKTLDAIKDLRIEAITALANDYKSDSEYWKKKAGASKSKLRQFFEKVEKVLILVGGIYVGAHL